MIALLNKIWNAFRLIQGWEIDTNIEQPLHTRTAIDWFNNKMDEALQTINDHFSKYRISDALMAVYKLIWDDFCSYFLEIVKPAYQKPIDGKSYEEIITIFEKLMQILHPFMPFLTEELWQNLRERAEGESIMITQMPQPSPELNQQLLARFANAQKVVESIRRIRATKNIPQKNAIELYIIKAESERDDQINAVITKLCNLSNIQYCNETINNSLNFIEQNVEYCIPLADNINKEEEIAKLKAELEYAEKFLQSVLKKLSNERFVANAPEQVVAIERKKQADSEEKIAMLKEQIENLSK